MINEKKIVAFLLIKYLHVNKYNQIGNLVLSENLTFSVRGNPLHLNFHGKTRTFSWFYRIPKSIRLNWSRPLGFTS